MLVSVSCSRGSTSSSSSSSSSSKNNFHLNHSPCKFCLIGSFPLLAKIRLWQSLERSNRSKNLVGVSAKRNVRRPLLCCSFLPWFGMEFFKQDWHLLVSHSCSCTQYLGTGFITAFIGFLLLSCLHVRFTKYVNFGRLRDNLWNVFNWLNFIREAPHSTGLTRERLRRLRFSVAY